MIGWPSKYTSPSLTRALSPGRKPPSCWYGRRLAGSVRTQQRDDLSLPHCDRDAPHGYGRTVVDNAHSVGAQECTVGTSRSVVHLRIRLHHRSAWGATGGANGQSGRHALDTMPDGDQTRRLEDDEADDAQPVQQALHREDVVVEEGGPGHR